MATKILDVTPDNYQKHFIHGEGRDWIETNCYIDVWVELLHSMGLDPVAALPCAFPIDFEGDQWTFFKFYLSDLDKLYGLDVQELNIWHDLLSGIEEQLKRKKHVLVELDSFFLPDTQGTAYKIDHVKTTVAVNFVDRSNKKMEYFHNQGYYSLEGADFDALFIDKVDDRVLPPYVEYAKSRVQGALSGKALVEASLESFKIQLRNIPEANPFESFKDRFEADFANLDAIDLEYFHKYSFATLRQFGAAFELCKTYLNWLKDKTDVSPKLDIAIDAYGDISGAAKILQFQLARAAARKKKLDLVVLDQASLNWRVAFDTLSELYL